MGYGDDCYAPRGWFSTQDYHEACSDRWEREETAEEKIKAAFLETTKMTFDRYDQWRLNFGKHNGKALKDVHSNYLLWMVKNDVDLYRRQKGVCIYGLGAPPSCYLKDYVEARDKIKAL